MSSVLRGARLTRSRREIVDFISSRESDRRIARSIVLVNEAHVIALLKAGVIDKREAVRLFRELRKLENRFPERGIDEDYHLYVEQELTKRLGPDLGGKIHAGKSRNDQVATAIRLTLRESLLSLSQNLLSFADQLVRQAGKYAGTFFVGYTHLQPAQPITYGHYLVAVADSLLRDSDRILEAYRRVNLSPMGSGALAGSSFNLDRRLVAQLLGFDGLIENSLDAIGSRDFLLESLAVCSLLASDLSRIAHDWIFYSSADVGLTEISDDYSSTSSMMPQKKNPDPLELIRAKCGAINGNHATAVTMIHALPSGYNLDFQELTPLVWNSLDALHSSLSIMTGIIAHTSPLTNISERYAVQFTVATEIANGLARLTGSPFRDAYRWVGQAVSLALRDHRTLRDLTSSEWNQITKRTLDERTLKMLQETAKIQFHSRIYRTEGSSNPREVRRMISSRRKLIKDNSQTVKTLGSREKSATRRMGRAL